MVATRTEEAGKPGTADDAASEAPQECGRQECHSRWAVVPLQAKNPSSPMRPLALAHG